MPAPSTSTTARRGYFDTEADAIRGNFNAETRREIERRRLARQADDAFVAPQTFEDIAPTINGPRKPGRKVRVR